MNQSSIQKTDVPVVETPVPAVQTSPNPMAKAVSTTAGFGQQVQVQSVFNDFNSLDDDEGFPIPKKQQFRPFAAQPHKNENDYVQQMIQANASNSLGFTAPPQNDGIKALVKSERKNRKKGKKSVKVQEFNDSNIECEKDEIQSLAQEDQTSQQQAQRSSPRQSEDQLTSEKNPKTTEQDDQSVQLWDQDNISNHSINRQIEAEADGESE